MLQLIGPFEREMTTGFHFLPEKNDGSCDARHMSAEGAESQPVASTSTRALAPWCYNSPEASEMCGMFHASFDRHRESQYIPGMAKEDSSVVRTTLDQCDLCGQQPMPNQSSTCTYNACRLITVACQLMNTLCTAPFTRCEQLMHGWCACYFSQPCFIRYQSDR